MIESSLGNWRKTRFRKSDAIRNKEGIYRRCEVGETPNVGEELVKGGWDHTHCSFCLGTINDGDQALSNSIEWICKICMENFDAVKMLQEIEKISGHRSIPLDSKQLDTGDADKQRR